MNSLVMTFIVSNLHYVHGFSVMKPKINFFQNTKMIRAPQPLSLSEIRLPSKSSLYMNTNEKKDDHQMNTDDEMKREEDIDHEYYNDNDEYDYYDEDIYDEEEEYYDENRNVWESYDGTDILLPPPNPDSNLPTAIIHFIGGTFLGSLPPRIAYRSFLEGLSNQHGNLVIIATSIPITENKPNALPKLISPLNHWKQIKIIRQKLKRSIRDVLYDEYQDTDRVDAIPVIGIGHSLGGRLQVLLHSHPSNDVYNRLKRKTNRKDVIANVLISFNNWNAPRSVPLLDEAKGVWKTSRGISQRFLQNIIGDDDDDDYDYDDDYDDGSSEYVQRRRRHKRKRRSKKDPMHFDDSMYQRERRRQQRSNKSKNNDETHLFEFDPSPETLWNIINQSSFTNNAIDAHNNDETKQMPIKSSFSYCIPKNLFIQFDDDKLDQSAELARRLMKVSTDTNNSIQNETHPSLDLKFARLKGNHLTPCISLRDGNILNHEIDNELIYFKSEELKKKKRMDQLNDLITTISTYVEFLVENSKIQEKIKQ